LEACLHFDKGSAANSGPAFHSGNFMKTSLRKTKAESSSSAPVVLGVPGTHYHWDCALATWHPRGVFDDELADRVVSFLEVQERAGEKTFDRFADLSGLDRIDLSLEHVFKIAARRKKGYRGKKVKSAILAVRMLTFAIAQVYQELMRGSSIEVGVFRDRAAAAKWLGVPEKTLRPHLEP
jgi:hypothetical protein